VSKRLESRFLRGLSTCALDAVIAAASRWQIPADGVVVHEGDAADRMFLLVSGSGRYVFYSQSGRKLLLIWLLPGDLFGGSALLEEPSRYLCSVELVKGSSVLVWERDTIRDLAARFPKLLENALSVASDYLVWYVATHVALTCNTAAERVAQVLVNLARGIGKQVPGGIALDITNEQLADASNVTPFTVSRLTSEWRRRSLITKHRGRIVVRFPERLLTSMHAKRRAEEPLNSASSRSQLARQHE